MVPGLWRLRNSRERAAANAAVGSEAGKRSVCERYWLLEPVSILHGYLWDALYSRARPYDSYRAQSLEAGLGCLGGNRGRRCIIHWRKSLIHLLRRNVNLQLLLFNNQIYGLTKGQFSPTSEIGKVTKSSPFGSITPPFNPISLSLGASASFVARTADRDTKHLTKVLKRAHTHPGSAFVEVYQNCNIYNDGAFFDFTERATKADRTVYLEHGKPMLFANGKQGVRLDGFKTSVFDIEGGDFSVSDAIVYDETSLELAGIVSRMSQRPDMPRPFGVFFCEERPTYEQLLWEQIAGITERQGQGDLDALLHAADTWTIQ